MPLLQYYVNNTNEKYQSGALNNSKDWRIAKCMGHIAIKFRCLEGVFHALRCLPLALPPLLIPPSSGQEHVHYFNQIHKSFRINTFKSQRDLNTKED